MTRGYRHNPGVSRTVVAEFKNVNIERHPFIFEKENKDQFIFYFGGREYGNWGGARFDEKILVHIPKRFVTVKEGDKYQIDPVICLRVMKKTIGENEHVYFTIDTPDTDEPELYLNYLFSYYKTTLKGYGKDRNYKEHIENECEVLFSCEVSTWANTERFGNKTELLIASQPVTIESSGVS